MSLNWGVVSWRYTWDHCWEFWRCLSGLKPSCMCTTLHQSYLWDMATDVLVELWPPLGTTALNAIQLGCTSPSSHWVNPLSKSAKCKLFISSTSFVGKKQLQLSLLYTWSSTRMCSLVTWGSCIPRPHGRKKVASVRGWPHCRQAWVYNTLYISL